MTGFSAIRDILKGLTRSTSWGEGLERHEILRHWAEAVGPEVAQRADPVEIKGRTLYVEVRDPVWLQQLIFLSETIRRSLNQAAGRDTLDKIFFRLADAPRQEDPQLGESDDQETERLRTQAAAGVPDREEIRAALTDIEDPEVREAIEKLLERAEGLKS